MEKTYKIIGATNKWIAQRDVRFNGKTTIEIVSGLSLKQARKFLLEYFCEDYGVYFPNWGVAMNSKIGRDNVTRHSDGTYSYWWDSRTYSIEEENKD